MTPHDDPRAAELRRRYLADQVETASPSQRVLMLLGKLLADMYAADEAFERMAIEPIHSNLVHAQEIVLVLRDSLSGSDWSGAEPLRAVYGFVHQRLVTCNVKKDRSLLPVCIRLVEQIARANTKAAAALEAPASQNGEEVGVA